MREKKREIIKKERSGEILMTRIKKFFFGLKICVLTSLSMCIVLGVYTLVYGGSLPTRIESGSDSERVILVQKKLKELGLYEGDCNGVYDVETADAVKRFQEYNGIYANGVCGNDTLQALGLSVYSYAEFEVDVLAKLIEAEAGDTDLQTMTAVGAVVLNRVHADGFPDSILQVVYSGGSFDSVVKGTLDKTRPSNLAYRAAEDALMGFDPTEGALYVLHGGSRGMTVTYKRGNIYFAR